MLILNLYARRIFGWALSDRQDAELVVWALDHGYEQRVKLTGALLYSTKAITMPAGYPVRDLRAAAWSNA